MHMYVHVEITDGGSENPRRLLKAGDDGFRRALSYFVLE